MNKEFDESTLDALIAYRCQRAVETVKEAELLASNNSYNAAINRLYYACFYIVCGLLAKEHISASTHDGVQQMFNLHFILSERLDKRYSRIYRRLFNDRMSGDYDDFIFYDKEMYNSIKPQVDDFIEAVKSLLQLDSYRGNAYIGIFRHEIVLNLILTMIRLLKCF